jgi:hypothetical protein
MDDVKDLFHQFLDCKVNTQQVAEKGFTNISTDVIKQVIIEQNNCLVIIDKLKNSNSELLPKYMKGIKVTENRILSEKQLYQGLTTSDYKNIPSYNLSANLVKMSEDDIWSSLQQPTKIIEKRESSTSFVTWSVFTLVVLLALYVKFSKKYNLNAQKVHEYFENKSFKKKNDDILKENPKTD